MPIGPAVRARLGRFETPAAEAYRAAFFSIDDFTRKLKESVPSARRILEIGCGDGSIANSVTLAYPGSEYVGIDISPAPGRRFEGDRSRAQFHAILSNDYIDTDPGQFDLVLIIDVLHHVPLSDRSALLRDAAQLLQPGGSVVIKEWNRSRTLPYLAGAMADRYVSGDKAASFMTTEELEQLMREGCPGLTERTGPSVRPWKCNGLFILSDGTKP